jgi:hypothetical protein
MLTFEAKGDMRWTTVSPFREWFMQWGIDGQAIRPQPSFLFH